MNNMGNYKFKKGDRVSVAKIDDVVYYGHATYKVGDVGIIVLAEEDSEYGNVYLIRWDRLKGTYRMNWWALESWLMLEKPLIKCE